MTLEQATAKVEAISPDADLATARAIVAAAVESLTSLVADPALRDLWESMAWGALSGYHVHSVLRYAYQEKVEMARLVYDDADDDGLRLTHADKARSRFHAEAELLATLAQWAELMGHAQIAQSTEDVRWYRRVVGIEDAE